MSRPATKNSLYVGSLAKDVTEEILRYAFMPFGPIKEIDLPADESTNSIRGYAFVTFDDADDCREALDNMNHNEINGQTIKVSFAHGHTKQAIWSMGDEEREEHRKQIAIEAGVDLTEEAEQPDADMGTGAAEADETDVQG